MIDKRFSGVAQGVGTQRILGRIHCGTIQIGQDILSTTFSGSLPLLTLILSLTVFSVGRSTNGFDNWP